MSSKKWTAECRFENGTVRRFELLTTHNSVRLFSGKEEIERLPAGTSKGDFIPTATDLVTEGDFVFGLGDGFLKVTPCGKYRPVLTVYGGEAKYVFGKTEIVTVAVASAVFVGLVLIATLLF